MAGSARAAERFQANLFRSVLRTGTSVVIVAETTSGLAGFAEVSQGADTPSFPTVARAAVAAMGLGGALRAAGRSLARRKVDLCGPEGGVHLVELQVTPELRNRGIGAFLLARVDEYAIAQNAEHVSLTTATNNPARATLRTPRLSSRGSEDERALRADHRQRRSSPHGQTLEP